MPVVRLMTPGVVSTDLVPSSRFRLTCTKARNEIRTACDVANIVIAFFLLQEDVWWTRRHASNANTPEPSYFRSNPNANEQVKTC